MIPGNGTFGFKNDGSQTTEYTYDANGNGSRDLNKGIGTISLTDPSIEGIKCNRLNSPKSVSIGGGTISYFYDATVMRVYSYLSLAQGKGFPCEMESGKN